MFINDFNPQGLINLTSLPFFIILKKTLLFAIFTNLFIKYLISKNKLLTNLFLISIILISISYFKIFPSILMLIIIIGAHFIGFKIYKNNPLVVSFVLGFFILIEFYILTGFIFGLKIGLLFILTISILFIINILKKYSFNNNFLKLVNKNIFNKLNLLDYWLISLSFTISSQPQTHWDAVHANLYNAKWYVINNSFNPLEESISSLFPQNAIGYYSLFYQIGQEKMLQLSFILPLFIVLFITKEFINQMKITKHYSLVFYLLIFSPIMIFESSNGYYDLLILSLLFTVLYLIFFSREENLYQSYLTSSFLIGFAAAIRYFPILFILLPLINLLSLKNKKKDYIFLILGIFFLAFFPLSIWLCRTFKYSGSPVFPFFQSIFPTPHLWSGSELTKNFMIQTTINSKQWLNGGFLIYPILSYFKTEQFMEATKGFTGLVYIFLTPIQLIALIKAIVNLTKKKLKKLDLIFLILFFVYLGIGLFSRYYRYLWPFQFLLAVSTILYFINIINKKNNYFLTIIIFIFLIFNINDALGYFRFFALDLTKIGNPDYYQQKKEKNNPILFLNNLLSSKDSKILDASLSPLPRFHLKGKVYQCNWYWINGSEKIKKSENSKIKAKKLITHFNYTITSNPFDSADNFCRQPLKNNQPLLKKIYSDNQYQIFKIDFLKKNNYR